MDDRHAFLACHFDIDIVNAYEKIPFLSSNHRETG